MTADPRETFSKIIDLSKSRVELAPHITFICGGEVDISKTTNHSVRNMFMNLSGRLPDKTQGFTLAENFKDWKDGYKSLSDFENDIAALSSIIVIILESPGSLAELGLFYANQELRKKMVLIVHREHYESESFIKFGFLNPMENEDEEQIKVYEIDNQNIETITEEEVKSILDDVVSHSEAIDKTEKFKPTNRGHVIFTIYQLIDLFTILTRDELKKYLERMELNLSNPDISTALYILQKFNLIKAEKKSAQTFYFSERSKADRIKFHFEAKSINASPERRYDAFSIKAEVSQFYHNRKDSDRSFARRLSILKRLQK